MALWMRRRCKGRDGGFLRRGLVRCMRAYLLYALAAKKCATGVGE
jgi:hypothetical protein